MESIVIPNLNPNENKIIEKNFDQKAKDAILNGFKNQHNKINNSQINSDLEKEKFLDYIICPVESCGEVSSGYISLETLKQLELKNIACAKCLNFFKFILCPHCKKKIYLPIYFELEQLLGYTLTCPYGKSCGKAFFKINCGDCAAVQTYKEAKEENSVLKCASEKCGKEFNFIRCPRKQCKKLMIYNLNIENNDDVDYENCNKNTFALNLFNKRITCNKLFCGACFFKFLCFKCKLINYTFSADYFEGAEIKCQNASCNEVFKRINCPKCFEENNFEKKEIQKGKESEIIEGYYDNSHLPDKVKCCNNACQQIFSKMNCLSCKAEDYSFGKKNFLEGKKVKCSSAFCASEFSFFNCVICSEINFWKKSLTSNLTSYEIIEKNKFRDDCNKILNTANNENNNIFILNSKNFSENKNENTCALVSKEIKDCYVRGQPVKCANCKITTSKINCPFCLEIITFSDFPCKYGVNYTCFNPKCLENFYINLCPCCAKTKIEKGKRIYVNFLSCPSKKDSRNIINNKDNNLIANGNEFGSNNNKLSKSNNHLTCENQYDFVICFQCNSYLFYYENEFNPNMALKCPQDTCKCVFLNFYCEQCSERILLKENQLDEFVCGECPNRLCKNPFKFLYCLECKFTSKTDLANKDEYLKSKKSFRKNSSISNSRKKSTNSRNMFCAHCAKRNNLDNNLIINNSNNLYNLHKQEDCVTPFNPNAKENKDLSINLNLFNYALDNLNNNKEALLNFSEGGKESRKFNILKIIKFSEGFLLRKPVYQLGAKADDISESFKNKISKRLFSVYDGNPPSYERCFDCNQMKESLVLFAPCGHKTSCEECYKRKYVNEFAGNIASSKCSKCSKSVASYVKRIFN